MIAWFDLIRSSLTVCCTQTVIDPRRPKRPLEEESDDDEARIKSLVEIQQFVALDSGRSVLYSVSSHCTPVLKFHASSHFDLGPWLVRKYQNSSKLVAGCWNSWCGTTTMSTSYGGTLWKWPRLISITWWMVMLGEWPGKLEAYSDDIWKGCRRSKCMFYVTRPWP